MPWLRLDDAFLDHPKVIGLTDRQLRVHLQAMLYASRYRTTGHVPDAALKAMRIAKRDRNALAAAALWDEDDAGDGIHVHDFAIYNGATLDDRIAAYIESNPGATGNEVHRAVGGRKQDVLRIIDSLRTGSQPVPGNQGGTTAERFPSGSRPARAHAHVRAVPTPTPERATSAAAVASHDTTTHDAAAAAIRTALDELGLNGTALQYATDEPDRAQAWLDLAQREAKTNPAAYILAGLRSHEWPSNRGPLKPRRTTTAPCPDCGTGAGNHTTDCPALTARLARARLAAVEESDVDEKKGDD